MSISSVTHRKKLKKKYALATATSVIDRSGVAQLIQSHTPAKSNRGLKPKLPQYELRPVLIVQQYLFIRGLHQSWANVLFAIWFDLSNSQLRDIGFPSGWRDKKRRAELLKTRPRADYEPFPAGGNAPGASTVNPGRVSSGTMAVTTPRLTQSALTFGHELNGTWDNEYKRFWKFINKALAPIDDTVASANKRQPAAEVRASQKDEAPEAARALRLRCMNAIIRGSLEHANAEHCPHVPAEQVLNGVLSHHVGDLAVDEHLFAVGLSKNGAYQLNNVKQLAARTAHLRREENGDAIGITVATTAFRPDGVRVPTVAMGIDVHAATSGAPQGARNAIQAVEAQGLRPTPMSNARQYVTGDKAYPHYVGFTTFLLEQRYTLHAKLGKNQQVVFDLAPTRETNEALASGPYLKGGCVLCPGIGAQFLQQNAHFDVPNEKKRNTAEYRQHQPIERQIQAAVMPTNGRPTRVKALGRGRPPAGAVAPNLYRVKVYCPALSVSKKVRCPIIKESMELPPTEPTLYNPPHPDRWPDVCKKGSQFVTLDAEQMKTYLGSGMVDGTWEHQDLYGPVRSRNEAFFGRLMNPNTGNLRLGAIDFDKNGPVSLAIAMAIAATNLQVMSKFYETAAGKPRLGDGARRRALRARVLAGQGRQRRDRTGRR